MPPPPESLDDPALPATDDAALARLERFGGGKLLTQMISLFIGAVPERIALARNGVAGNDPKAVEMALHALKSSAAQLGAMRMHRLSERGELIARGGSVEDVGPLVEELDVEFVRVQTWLENALNPEKA